jgi:hypothetical protein
MEKNTLQPVQKTEKVLCKFIGEFLVGDNIVKNAEALCRMHANNNGALFNKFMLVQMGSIVEASLDQIFYRARNHTVEGLQTSQRTSARKSQKRTWSDLPRS